MIYDNCVCLTDMGNTKSLLLITNALDLTS